MGQGEINLFLRKMLDFERFFPPRDGWVGFNSRSQYGRINWL